MGKKYKKGCFKRIVVTICCNRKKQKPTSYNGFGVLKVVPRRIELRTQGFSVLCSTN